MLYVIEDGTGKIMQIQTRMWNVSVTVLAIFTEEQAALDVLYEVEKSKAGKHKFRIAQMEDSIVLTEAAKSAD